MPIKKFFQRIILAWVCAATTVLANSPTQPLVVYSGRSEALVGPLFKKFTDQTGIVVDVRYNDTGPLATQTLIEGAQTPADVFFFQESGYLSLLGKKGLLQPLPEKLRINVPTHWQDKQHYWIATSARARVLAYNTQKLQPADLPTSLKELTNPRWKGKIGWAPGNASLQAHISALRHVWGEQETAAWLRDFMANDPVSYPKNAAQVLAVGRGEIEIAWVNHYYLYQLKKQQPDLPVANYSFTQAADAGNLLILSGIAMRKQTPKQAQAEKLIAFFLSPAIQTYFAEEIFEYPTRRGIATSQQVPSINTLRLTTVDQDWLTDVQPTLSLLRQMGAL